VPALQFPNTLSENRIRLTVKIDSYSGGRPGSYFELGGTFLMGKPNNHRANGFLRHGGLFATLFFCGAVFVFSQQPKTQEQKASPTPAASPKAASAFLNPKNEKKRQEIRKMSQETLARLYREKPEARKFIESSAGYAVFNNTGVKILVSGSGRGKGVAVNNKTKRETFMKMFELQAGLGIGVKKFRLVFVFENEKALNGFVDSGWEFGGQASAAARTSKDKGASTAGAVSVSDGVWIYQLTDKGLALELTAKGSKYYKDDDLNK
jgi:lipid-binding SYLF domain-containing protein